MFCPSCGVKEDQLIQFCRTCGTDLRVVRGSLEQPEQAAASAAVAREEVARAVAVKIQEGNWWQVGMMVPEVERLFESPQDRYVRLLHEAEAKRLRLLRAGVITAATGFGTILLFLMASLAKPDLLLLAGPSLVVLIIGLGILINGLLFTVPKTLQNDRRSKKQKQELFAGPAGNFTSRPGTLPAARPSFSPAPVTEHTTRHLSSELVEPPRRNNV